jgi:interleukin-1 receptor-associated kinase 1
LEEAGRYIPLEKYVEQVEACILIGLLCVDADPNKRPTTFDIIEKLTKVDITNTDRGTPKSTDARGFTGRPHLTTRSFLVRFRRTIVIVLLELHKIGTNATGNRSFLERLHASITMATLVQELHSLDLDPSASLCMVVQFLALENMRGKNNARRRSEDILLKERPEQIWSVLEDGARTRLSDEEDHMPSVSVQHEDWEALQRQREVQVLTMQFEISDRSRNSELGVPKPKLSKLRATAPVCMSAVWLAAGIGFLCGLTLGEMRGSRRTRVTNVRDANVPTCSGLWCLINTWQKNVTAVDQA